MLPDVKKESHTRRTQTKFFPRISSPKVLDWTGIKHRFRKTIRISLKDILLNRNFSYEAQEKPSNNKVRKEQNKCVHVHTVLHRTLGNIILTATSAEIVPYIATTAARKSINVIYGRKN